MKTHDDLLGDAESILSAAIISDDSEGRTHRTTLLEAHTALIMARTVRAVESGAVSAKAARRV